MYIQCHYTSSWTYADDTLDNTSTHLKVKVQLSLQPLYLISRFTRNWAIAQSWSDLMTDGNITDSTSTNTAEMHLTFVFFFWTSECFWVPLNKLNLNKQRGGKNHQRGRLTDHVLTRMSKTSLTSLPRISTPLISRTSSPSCSRPLRSAAPPFTMRLMITLSMSFRTVAPWLHQHKYGENKPTKGRLNVIRSWHSRTYQNLLSKE